MHKQGKIVLIPFPFTDLSGLKIRPAVIVSNKPVGDDVVVAFISTNIKKKEKFGIFIKMDRQNGLKSDSIVLISKMATLEKKIIVGEIGQLSDIHIKQVKEKINNLLSRIVVRGYLRNDLVQFIRVKFFGRNRYVLFLVSLILVLQAIIWILWVMRISNSGFALESFFNFLLNIPSIPRHYSLLFFCSFVSFLNILLSFFAYRKEKFFSILLLFATVIINSSVLLVAIYYIFNLGL